jgi:ferredoxin
MVQGVSPEAVYDAPVQAPGRVGMETFLSAVALGAVLVFVIPEEEAGGVSLSVTGEQVRWSRLLLDALGCRQMLVRMLAPGTRRIALQPTLITPFRPGGAPGAAADFSMPKRAIILRALRQLGGSREAPVGYEAGMPVKAPFGGLFINPQKCSLCMACAGVCTAEALQGISGIEPGLAFSESACIQCGLCAKVCPEGALETVSRFDLQALLGGSAKTLHTAPAHCCPVCGDRYGSPALIDRIRQKLSEHWMYRGAKGREMLSMCTRCRIQYGREHPGTWEKE